MSELERQRWRDEHLSGRHRYYGSNCPMQDIDYQEFDDGVPVCLVDYKHCQAQPFEHMRPRSVRALSMHFNEFCQQLPFFIVRYWPLDGQDAYGGKPMKYAVLAVNKAALLVVGRKDDWIAASEVEYVRFLYRLRDNPEPTIRPDYGWVRPTDEEVSAVQVPPWVHRAGRGERFTL